MKETNGIPREYVTVSALLQNLGGSWLSDQIARGRAPLDLIDEIRRGVRGAELILEGKDEEFQKGLPKSFDTITKSSSIPFSDLTHLVDTEIKYVISPICPEGALTLVQGMPKGGKSTFSLWLALSASIGLWTSEIFKIPKPRKTLFIEFEDSPILVIKRASRYLAGVGQDRYTLPENLILCDSPQLWLDSQVYEDALTQEIRDKEYEFIVIDTLSYVHNCEDENSSAQMKLVTASLKRMVKATNCSVIMIHHCKKSSAESSIAEKARGSSAIAAAADVILDWGNRNGTDLTPVECVSKYDDGISFNVEYKRVPDGIQWIVQNPKKLKEDSEAMVLKQLQECLVGSPDGVPTATLIKLLGHLEISRATVHRQLNCLLEKGIVSRNLHGKEYLYKILYDNNLRSSHEIP